MDTERNFGDRLYEILPALYRNRDASGDLKRYLVGCGELLDRVYATLVQLHADHFPDTPFEGAACQDWLLPYFAGLLDVRLISPLPNGRRAEITHAINWRQGKGTPWVIEDVAEGVGDMEVVLQEGFKRVILTPRVDVSLVPASAYGYEEQPIASFASLAARHPVLPAATVDFRCASGAVSAKPVSPGAQFTEIDGNGVWWRQASYHGVPCHPGGFDDVSRRTVDFRDGDYARGFYHPRRVLLYVAPHPGFWPPGAPSMAWNLSDPALHALLEVEQRPGTLIVRNKSLSTPRFVPVHLTGAVTLGDGSANPNPLRFRFEGVTFEDALTLTSGTAELERCAVKTLTVQTNAPGKTVLSAKSCLFDVLDVQAGNAQLEYTSVLGNCSAPGLFASDCLFAAAIQRSATDPQPPGTGCVRRSRHVPAQDQTSMRWVRNTTAATWFFESTYGQRSCGVLHPATHATVLHGAEDGAEVGAYHVDRSGTIAQSVIEKLNDFLPVGVSALVVHDPQLVGLPQQAGPSS